MKTQRLDSVATMMPIGIASPLLDDEFDDNAIVDSMDIDEHEGCLRMAAVHYEDDPEALD